MEKAVKFTVRFPEEIHARLVKRHDVIPHVSLNVMVIEYVREALEKEEAKIEKRGGVSA